MSLQTKRIWAKVMWIVMLIDGIILCCTLFGLPFGIPSIIGATRFKDMQAKDDAALEAKIKEKENFGWSIFAIIVSGVIGILGMIFIYCLETKKEN